MACFRNEAAKGYQLFAASRMFPPLRVQVSS